MTTLTELHTWLQQPDHIRVVLVEVLDVKVGASASTFYLSSIPYTSDTTNYDPVIVGGVTFNESISTDGTISIGFGDIEIENTNGTKDSWFTHIWDKRDILVKIGDPRWSYSQFYTLFTGQVDSIQARDRNGINIVLVDKLQRLDVPIQINEVAELTAAFGEGSTVSGSIREQNKDKLIPIIFGEVFNIEGTTVSNAPTSLLYSVSLPTTINSSGGLCKVLEVRDNGVQVNYTENLSNGTFTLSQSSYGQITASIQGTSSDISNPIQHSAPYIVKEILKNFGDPVSRFIESEFDSTYSEYLASSTTYNPLLSYQMPSVFSGIRTGVYCNSGETKLDICQTLLSSMGLHLIVSSSGKVKLVQYNLPNTADTLPAENYITDLDIEYATLSITERSQPKRAVRLGYCKNYTPQVSNLAGAISDNTKNLFIDEWIIQTAVSTLPNDYNLPSKEPEIEGTALISTVDAQNEASRRLKLWEIPRTVYSFTGYPHLLTLELGAHISMTFDRFGLSDTKGLVVSLSKSWITGRVTVGVLV